MATASHKRIPRKPTQQPSLPATVVAELPHQAAVIDDAREQHTDYRQVAAHAESRRVAVYAQAHRLDEEINQAELIAARKQRASELLRHVQSSLVDGKVREAKLAAARIDVSAAITLTSQAVRADNPSEQDLVIKRLFAEHGAWDTILQVSAALKRKREIGDGDRPAKRPAPCLGSGVALASCN